MIIRLRETPSNLYNKHNNACVFEFTREGAQHSGVKSEHIIIVVVVIVAAVAVLVITASQVLLLSVKTLIKNNYVSLKEELKMNLISISKRAERHKQKDKR